MRVLKAAAIAVAMAIASTATASTQSLDFGSLGSSTSAPQLTETVTTPTGLTANYRVENCNGSYRISGKLSATQRGYMWLNYEGTKNGDWPGQVVYGKMPLWSVFLDPGYETDEVPLGAAGSVVSDQPAYLTFGFDPFGPNGIINVPDDQRSVRVAINPATVQGCS